MRASLTIEKGKISVSCPGQLTVHASNKVLTGPSQMDYLLRMFPGNVCIECLMKAAAKAQPLVVR